MTKPAIGVLVHRLSKGSFRSKKHWAFGHSGDVFAGNPKYLFLWMSIHRPDLRVTWVTGNNALRDQLQSQGYRAVRRWSIAGILTALTAKVFIFAHGVGNVNAYLSGGAIQVNLWHGVGLKAIHLGHGQGKTARAGKMSGRGLARRSAAIKYLNPYDVIVTTSDFMQAHFADQLRVPVQACPQLGYPRLDCAADHKLAAVIEEQDARLGFHWDSEGYDEIYVYMPTYRNTGRSFFAAALPDIEQLSRILAGRNALLYIKPHPDTKDSIPAAHNIRRWPDAIDVTPYLARFTGLITDYSSVLYDYIFTNDTGVILYTFDFEQYVSLDHTLLYPFDENVAGSRVSDFEALCACLESGEALHTNSDYARIRQRFWHGSSNPASPAIVDYVLRALEG